MKSKPAKITKQLSLTLSLLAVVAARSVCFAAVILIGTVSFSTESSAATSATRGPASGPRECRAIFSATIPLAKQVILAPTLARALVSVQKDPQLWAHLSLSLRKRLRDLAQGQDPRTPKGFAGAVDRLKEWMSAEDLARALGESLQPIHKALMQSSSLRTGADDSRDMVRDWGWKLLANDDKAFRDPEFLNSRIQMGGQAGGGGYVNDLEGRKALAHFRREWSALTNSEVLRFTVTGAQANSLVYQIAKHNAYSPRAAAVKAGREQAHFLVMDKMWVATDGSDASLLHSSSGDAEGLKGELTIKAPYTYEIAPQDPREIARLEPLEANALSDIEKRITQGPHAIGAILIEPIIGAMGVRFFRTEFLMKLRELCDRLKIPIVADEILTGGGRTGKFFAFENYEGFQPDFVTFGKGLQVAGIAEVNRGQKLFRHSMGSGSTTFGVGDSLLKSAAILKRIRENHLIENAADVGAYMLKRLREADPHPPDLRQGQWSDFSRGLGLMLYTTANQPISKSGVMGRLTPYLSLTKADVDRLLRPAEPSKVEWVRYSRVFSPTTAAYARVGVRTGDPAKALALLQSILEGEQIAIDRVHYDEMGALENITLKGFNLQPVLDLLTDYDFREKHRKTAYFYDRMKWSEDDTILEITVDFKNSSTRRDDESHVFTRIQKNAQHFGGTADVSNFEDPRETARHYWAAVPRDHTQDFLANMTAQVSSYGKVSFTMKSAHEN